MTIGEKLFTSSVEKMKTRHTIQSVRDAGKVDTSNSSTGTFIAISVTLDCIQLHGKELLEIHGQSHSAP